MPFGVVLVFKCTLSAPRICTTAKKSPLCYHPRMQILFWTLAALCVSGWLTFAVGFYGRRRLPEEAQRRLKELHGPHAETWAIVMLVACTAILGLVWWV